MPRRPIHLPAKLRDMLAHAEPLPPEADSPVAHYGKTSDDVERMLNYFEANRRPARARSATVDRYLARLRGMAVISVIEAFERYLKETAAVCIDALRPYVLDDRYDGFTVGGAALAAHFGTDTLGRSLCETATWLDTDKTNKRFRALLADPFEDGKFELFPKGKAGAAERERFVTLELVWQLRHTIVHNVGVMTASDAVVFRVLAKRDVAAPVLLAPTPRDVRYLKRFLDEAAADANARVAARLAELLTALQPGPAARPLAEQLATAFRVPVTVAGAAAVPPP